MFKNLLFVSLAPVLIAALYIYIRDKYEREPVRKLLASFAAGALVIPAILVVERFFFRVSEGLEGTVYHAYNAFIVASFTEEAFKYIAFFLIIWRSVDFNEKFDGIVYAVFISLGFAAVENVMYVYSGGYQVGMLRAFTAVPAHAFFGVSMGYHFGMAKFYPDSRNRELTLAFFFPFIWHGFYDFFLMTGKPWLIAMFIPLILWLGISAFRKMKLLSDISVYRTTVFINKGIGEENAKSGGTDIPG
ncbi:MAG: PrsW family intramembrane metalloprotease [Bacteroidales bacterium]|nr:PrsW family intramembrane metalloprotease [Bacteroidales bacterium]